MSSPSFLDRHQVAFYIGALTAGGVVGLTAPGAGTGLERAISPLLAALLYVTFLQVPAVELVRSLRAGRFLGAALVVNFVVVPLVVAALSGFLPADRAVRLGVLLVLLAPCVDYVIVFSSLAGGSGERLLAATPVLLLAQMVLLPGYLYLFLGPELAEVVDTGPFLEAFLVLIVVPLALAWLTQGWAGRRASDAVGVAMVPLMAVTLLTVVASQVPKLDGTGRLDDLIRVVPVYMAFLAVMPFASLAVVRLFQLRTRDGRAIIFTGATRNSLVVLPLALSLPDTFAAAGAVVVTQTLVEVVGMVVYVRVVPRLLRQVAKVA